MHLKIILPFQVFVDVADVLRIVAQTPHGSFGILPHRLDCVACLAPSVFIYETKAQGEVAVAIDEGILIKTGFEALVAVRDAVGGADLGHLRQAVERQISNLDERQKTMRSVLAQLESSMVRRLIELQRHG